MKILYIPGWAAGRAPECQLVEELSRTFQVETIWLPDYGNPDCTPSQPVAAIYKPSLLKRIEQKDGSVALVGWSLGAMAALEAAAEAPSCVKALVIISGAVKFCADEASARQLRSLAAHLEENPEDALRGFFLAAYHPTRPKAHDLKGRIRGAMEAAPEQLRLGLDYLLRADLGAAARAVRIPTLVAHGRQDAIIPIAAGEQLVDSLRNAQFCAFDNAGHMLPDLHAGEICSLLGSFLCSM